MMRMWSNGTPIWRKPFIERHTPGERFSYLDAPGRLFPTKSKTRPSRKRGKGGKVRIFITYAREDGAAVAQLGADLERSKRQVWIDRELTGGQAWWEEILQQIRACDLYVFALSASSLDSRPCLRELEYALALGRRLLPIKIGEVSIQQAPRVIADAQVVDYVGRTPDGVLALRDAIDHAPPSPALPDPLPAPPAVPISYFGHYREQVGADSLPFSQQQSLLLELKSHLGNEDDRDDALDLLSALRRRHDLAQSVASEIDAILATVSSREPALAAAPTPSEPAINPLMAPSPAPPPPPPPHRLRWLFAGIGLTVVLSVLVTYAGATPEPFPPSSTTTAITDTTAPDTTVPDTSIPDTTIPDPTVPDTTVPEDIGCLLYGDEISLLFPDTEYGPIGDGYYLIWSWDGFWVYDSLYASSTDFPGLALDTWHSLDGVPFQVCIDTAGVAFAAYTP
jgi:hypothetical protein